MQGSLNAGNVACTEKQPSQMDTMLDSLDQQVSRYYNTLNQIKRTRLTIQEDSPCPVDESKQLKPGIGFNPGVFYRFQTILTRFSELNNEAELEAKTLNSYI